MTTRQRKREAKQEKQGKQKVKKKESSSDHLWKVVLAFVLIIGIATAAIYFVAGDKTLKEQKSGKTVQDKKSDSKAKEVVDEEKPSQSNENVDVKDGTVIKEAEVHEKVVKEKKKVKKPQITNKYDNIISQELKDAEKLLKDRRFERAQTTFQALVNKHPDSPRAMYGLARATDQLADIRRSNELLQQAIDLFSKVDKVKDCPKTLKKLAVFRQAERLQFLGHSHIAVKVLQELAQSIPNNVEVWNKIGVEYLIKGINLRAKPAFEKALSINPDDGHALVHIGFILKSESKYAECIPYFERGLATGEDGTDVAKFYFHLGDAYYRLGKANESYEVYERGAQRGHFLSKMQRSLYNADTPLRAKPYWDPAETPYVKSIRMLEKNWKTIRDEGVALYDPSKEAFVNEDEGLRETGSWQQFTMYSQGRRDPNACAKAPNTCKLVDKIHDATGCKRGQIKFSVMRPGTHIWAHCGPTNCRIRGHLGLVIPKDVTIRVGAEARTWKEGKMIIIDDSIEHEVWHNGTTFRMILIVDFWHPDLSPNQRNTLSPI